jgi:hypothetical protein
VAELVIGEMILLCRRIFQAVDETRANTFNKSQESRFEVQGKTLGLLGLGEAQLASRDDAVAALQDLGQLPGLAGIVGRHHQPGPGLKSDRHDALRARLAITTF